MYMKSVGRYCYSLLSGNFTITVVRIKPIKMSERFRVAIDADAAWCEFTPNGNTTLSPNVNTDITHLFLCDLCTTSIECKILSLTVRMKNRISLQLYTVLLLFFPAYAVAHEMWVLTTDMVDAWNNKPLPSTFTSFTIPTVLTLAIALGIIGVLVSLHRNGANELFPLFRARMRAMRPYASVVLRFCLSWVLMSSALAMEPRFGNAAWSDPSLLAPDILISDLPVGWHWLRWMQMVISIALFAGVYVRVAAAACLLLVGFSLFLTGMAALSYAPVYIAVALYLFTVGGGSYYVPLPVHRTFDNYCQRLMKNETVSRAQFVLRVLTGFNFLYLAVYFKVLQPNLMLAIIQVHKLPIMGFDPEVFLVITATAEVSIGLLMIFGILLRFLSLALIGAFTFFAICLSDAENLTSHILYYGVAVSFLFNGIGQWRKRKPTDSTSKIVILGNSISAVAAAQYLERILPKPSNVQITLLSERSDVQFKAMLPEVVSGAVQPNTLINSLTKVLERTNIVLANARSIDTVENTVAYFAPGGDSRIIRYDQLIIANDPQIDYNCESPVNCEGIEHLDSVVDALKLKQKLLRCLLNSNNGPENQVKNAINIAIYGGGERGSALAMEIYSLIQTLINDRCIPRWVRANLAIFESTAEQNNMNDKILELRKRHFVKRDIKVLPANTVSALSSDSLRLPNGKTIEMDIVVNLRIHDVLPRLSRTESLPDPIRTDKLALGKLDNVWLASYDEVLKKNPQRRISLQLEQSQLAAFNAWAQSQNLENRALKKVKKSVYECYMGRYSIATWRGLALPGALGWLLNRRRYLSTLPSMERKLRIVIDWALDFVFNNDTCGFLEHDYQVKAHQYLHKVPEQLSENDSANEADNMITPFSKAS